MSLMYSLVCFLVLGGLRTNVVRSLDDLETCIQVAQKYKPFQVSSIAQGNAI